MTDDLCERIALALGWRREPQPHGLVSWIAPDGTQYAEPPALTTDAALALITPAFRFRLTGFGRWAVESDYCTPGYEQPTVFYGDTLAETIAEAWLPWKGQQHDT